MDRILIEGGTPLSGEVEISGAKNASLPLMAGALLADSPSQLEGIPRLRDIDTMGRMFEHLGARLEYEPDSPRVLHIDPAGFHDTEAPYDLVRQMRASIYVLGPLLARFGHARVSLPGGCAIGTRPIDLHLHGLRALGADIRIEHGYVEAAAPKNGLKGADVTLSGPQGSSVGATCNVLMAASLARGRSVLRGAAHEPHVDDLVSYLNRMGARIEGAGTGVLTVEGVRSLQGAAHRVIPDSVEAATYMVAAAMTRGDVILRNCRPEHMRPEIEKMLEMGASVEVLEDGASVRVHNAGPLRPVSIRTAPYPGFATDMQAQFMAAMSLAPGESHVIETVFPDRFMHAAELNRMGADITVSAGSAVVRGVRELSGAAVMASDLRASVALVLAGLAARGRTEIHRIYHLDRGYENLVEKLKKIGAHVDTVS